MKNNFDSTDIQQNYFSLCWFFCFLVILLFHCLLLIYLVSCENTFMFVQQRCALRGNFLILVFTFPIFHKRKGGIFRFTRDKRSLFGNLSWVSFLHIPHCFKFLVVLQFSLACLGGICWMYVCASKINFQSFDFFVFFWCWSAVVYYTFL